MLEKEPFNFLVNKLRDIVKSVREGLRVGQKMSVC